MALPAAKPILAEAIKTALLNQAANISESQTADEAAGNIANALADAILAFVVKGQDSTGAFIS